MTEPTAAYHDYVGVLRELDTVRAGQESAAQARQSQRSGLQSHVDQLWARLDTQRTQFAYLASQCELPEPPTHANPVPPPADINAEVHTAANDIAAADAGYTDSQYLAHRAKILPRWRADERNGAIYGVSALLGMVAQIAVLASAAGTEKFWDMLPQLLGCIALPFIAFTAGWLAIGAISNPILGEGTLTPTGKLQRNPRLGMVICLSTWLVTCWLANAYLNL